VPFQLKFDMLLNERRCMQPQMSCSLKPPSALQDSSSYFSLNEPRELPYMLLTAPGCCLKACKHHFVCTKRKQLPMCLRPQVEQLSFCFVIEVLLPAGTSSHRRAHTCTPTPTPTYAHAHTCNYIHAHTRTQVLLQNTAL